MSIWIKISNFNFIVFTMNVIDISSSDAYKVHNFSNEIRELQLQVRT